MAEVLPAVRNATVEPRTTGLFGTQIRQIGRALGLSRGFKSVPGQNAGWGRAFGPGSLTSRISDYIETYGGDTPISWIFACTSLIVDEMSMYPYGFVDPTSAADLSRCTPIEYRRVPLDLKQLLQQPNQQMTWADMVAYKEMDCVLVGNSYWLQDQMNGLDQPDRLMRMLPQFTRIATNNRGEVIGFVYTVQGVQIPYEVDEVLHFKEKPNPHSEYYGMGIVQGIIQDAGVEIGVNEHVVGFFTNGAKISGILTISGTLPEEAFNRIKDQFREEYGGSTNAFSVLVAEQGLEFRPITQPPAATGVKELRELSKDAILSGFGVHAEMLGGTSNAGDVKMGDAQVIFSRKMRPRAKRTSEALTWNLTAKWGNIGLWISTTDVETQQVKVARARDMLGAGASVNEARIEMGQPPYTRENFSWLTDEEERLAWTPILPSGYDPYYVSQQGDQGPFANVQPGGSNGNTNGTGQPTAPAGSPDRDRVRSVRALTGKAMLELPSGTLMPVPEGFEDLGELAVTEAETSDAEQLIALQARIYTEEVRPWELEMVGFFNDQRNRVLREMGKFVSRHNAKRLSGTIDKKDLHVSRIFYVDRENNELDQLYRVRATGVAQRTVNEIAEIFDAAPADVRGIVDEIASRVQGINETTRARIERQIAVGISRGYSTQQIANGVPDEQYLGVAGVFDSATETRAIAIARTETSVVYNMASLGSYAQIGVQRVEVVDGEADGGCREARGSVWLLSQARANPVEHPNCVRSFVPIFTGTGRD